MIRNQLILDINDELLVDNFAGGGGASTGIELALGRHVDIAINHDPEAVKMHQANHPQTAHHCESVWDVDPVAATGGRPVGLAWFSPDCKHFSKAKGGKPRDKAIRGLALVALRWVIRLQKATGRGPRVIKLENVEEFQTWGPLLPDGSLNPKCKGQTFRAFVGALRRRGYVVEWRELRACDYGAPTIRKRLFLIARCDGRPIVWPAPTHGAPTTDDVKSGKLLPWRTAAECIEWSLPCPSIFERARPLAEATCRRIARGIMRYVVNCSDPFIAPVTHVGDSRVHSVNQPLRTITCAQRGEMALVSPHVTKFRTGSTGSSMAEPLHTVTAGPKEDPAGAPHAMGVVAAFLAKHYGGNETPGWPLHKPISTVTAKDHHGLIAAHVMKMRGAPESHAPGQAVRDPVHTVSAQGNHFAEVRAFLIKYYGSPQDPRLNEPLHTVTTRDRFGLVTVNGEEYAIIDIGLRMLAPRELYRAQGFPDSYRIGDNPAQGLTLTKSAQVRMCGNSVCPPLAAALVAANVPELSRWEKKERVA